jgi:hypothetical protein
MRKRDGVVNGEIFGYDSVTGGSKKGGSKDLIDHPAFKKLSEDMKAGNLDWWADFKDTDVKQSQRSLKAMLCREGVSVNTLKEKVHELETSLENCDHHRMQSELRLIEEINEVSSRVRFFSFRIANPSLYY